MLKQWDNTKSILSLYKKRVIWWEVNKLLEPIVYYIYGTIKHVQTTYTSDGL